MCLAIQTVYISTGRHYKQCPPFPSCIPVVHRALPTLKQIHYHTALAWLHCCHHKYVVHAPSNRYWQCLATSLPQYVISAGMASEYGVLLTKKRAVIPVRLSYQFTHAQQHLMV